MFKEAVSGRRQLVVVPGGKGGRVRVESGRWITSHKQVLLCFSTTVAGNTSAHWSLEPLQVGNILRKCGGAPPANAYVTILLYNISLKLMKNVCVWGPVSLLQLLRAEWITAVLCPAVILGLSFILPA